jgi:hypothetical protein
LPGQPGFWSVEDRLRELSAQGDPLEQLRQIVDFELFRPVLAAAAGTADRSKGGRPPFDVCRFEVQDVVSASSARAEFRADRTAGARSSLLDAVLRPLDRRSGTGRQHALGFPRGADCIRRVRAAVRPARSGHRGRRFHPPRRCADRRCFADGAFALPRQRNTREEKEAIKAGKTANEIWPDDPAKAAQKDTDARWTVKTSKGKAKTDGTVQSDLAIPEVGYKTHVSIDVEHGFIRRQKVTDAAARDGAR